MNNAAVDNRDSDVKTRFQLCMNTNVIEPAIVSAAFRSLLLKASKAYSIYVSSIMGLMIKASTSTLSVYRSMPNEEAYRSSKAALNMVALQKSIEFNSTVLKVFAMCSEFVRSNLRGQSEDARSE